MDMWLIGTAVGLVVPAIVAVSAWNRLMALDARCDTAFADVDVQLKHRHNVLPNLVETVRAFAAHERGAIIEVTRARASALQASGPGMRLEAETQLGQSIHSLMSVAERYPDLAASAHFRELRGELLDAENRITAARRFHNLAIAEFNATLRQFPGSLIAPFARLSAKKPFDLGLDRVLMDEPATIRL